MTHRQRMAVRGLQLEGLVGILMGIVFVVLPAEGVRRSDPMVLFTFALNGLLWLLLLVAEVNRRPFSFAVIHYSFCLLFFFFAALVQYTHNRFPWVGWRSDEILLTTNLALTLWTFGLWCGRCPWRRRRRAEAPRPLLDAEIDCTRLIYLSLAVLAAIAAFRISTVGMQSLWARATSGYAVSESSSVSLLVDHSVQAAAYYAAALAVLACRQNRRLWKHALACVLLLVLSYPPTGMARYAAAAIYLGLLLTFSDRLKRGRSFIFLFLGGFAVVLPFLNAYRSASAAEVDVAGVLRRILDNFATEWLAGDYDAYTLLSLAIDNAAAHGIRWGRQLLGVALFWVPRAVWPGKPVGTGHLIATDLGWSFANLSCPLPAEALVNFGWVGVPVLALLVGRLTRLLDEWYWKNRGGQARCIDLLYPVVVIFFFFVSRGDLLSSTAYMMAYVAVWALLSLALGRKSTAGAAHCGQSLNRFDSLTHRTNAQ